MLGQAEEIPDLIDPAILSCKGAVVITERLAEIGSDQAGDVDAFSALAHRAECQIGPSVGCSHLPGPKRIIKAEARLFQTCNFAAKPETIFVGIAVVGDHILTQIKGEQPTFFGIAGGRRPFQKLTYG